jgi:protein-disulfide isomerase
MKKKQQQRLPIITVALAIVAIAAVLVLPRLGGNSGGSATAFDTQGRPLLGNPDAAVTMVVFEDFRCPACQTFELSVFPAIERDYVDTGRVKVVAMSLPVVNPVAASEHVARVAKCVYQQSNDAFWEMKPPLFRSQPELGDARRAVELALSYAPGIDAGALDACLGDPASFQLVRNDVELATSLQVRGTPSIFVNGQMVATPTAAAVRAALDAALRN